MTLFTGPHEPRDVAGANGGPPRLVRRLDAHGARALGIGRGEGLLVRPDGVPVGRCAGGPRAARRDTFSKSAAHVAWALGSPLVTDALSRR